MEKKYNFRKANEIFHNLPKRWGNHLEIYKG